MKSYLIVVFVSLVVAWQGLSCGPEPKEVSSPVTATPIVPSAATRERWQSEWERVTAEAKKEGELSIYSPFSSAVRTALIEALQQKYGLRLEATTGRNQEIAQKFVRENQAGLNLVDIIITGAPSGMTLFKPTGLLSSLEPVLLLPESKDPQGWPGGNLPFIDKDKTLFHFAGGVSAPITINTNMVKTGEIVSMRDILNPRWQGKISLNNPLVGGGGLSWFAAFSELLGYDFMRDLARMNPELATDRRLQVEWTARGRYPVGIAADSQTVQEFIAAGAPLAQMVPKEGAEIMSGSGVLGLVAKAPHPNAAKFFVNWLLTKEGQTLYSTAQRMPSARVDAPTNQFDPITVRQPGAEYIMVDKEDFMPKMAEKERMAKEIFGHLVK
ncbi:MAG: extracellular solute-binding protein [Chloroflexi bacterium]|nr:extracellular solute-binding protein [Chloroflexota bacterium]